MAASKVGPADDGGVDSPVPVLGVLEPSAEAGAGGDVPTICLIGPTGTGKSSTGNTFFKWQSDDVEGRFPVSAEMTSMTYSTKVKTHPWRGSEHMVRCVDTPGLCDTEGRDREHVASMVDVLKDSVKYVNAFLILFNGQDTKLNGHLKDMLIVFRDTFGEEFLKNVMLGFTHWEYDRKAKLKRKKSNTTSEQKASMMNKELRATLGHGFDCPCVFLDNQINECNDEELQELYEDELDNVMTEFHAEIDKVFAFLRTALPFYCQGIEAAVADKDALRRSVGAWLRVGPALATETLGRRLILAESDVIGKGWLRYRRRWIYCVLRRQHLRFYTDEAQKVPTDPEHIDLTGSVCHESRRSKIAGWWFFSLYRPWTYGSEHDQPIEFSVGDERNRKQWVLLIGEATQISESCHRIQRFYESLRAATCEPEYVSSLSSTVASNTMVIPVEWVRHVLGRTAYEPASLEQAGKDLGRDTVKVEGHVFSCPRTDDLAIAVARHILRKVNREGRCDSDGLDAKAIVMARDVILSCSRSEGGGDTFDALRFLFGTDLVHIVPDSFTAGPVSVRVLHAGDAEDPASPKKGFPTVDSSSGLPQFESDASAEKLSMDKVRSMVLDGDQKSKVNAVDRSSWVPDDQMPQCMRCGVQFNTWIRRHHCRACGCLVCFHCSRHFVPMAPAGDASAGGETTKAGDIAAGSEVRQRVCFLCYQRAVIEDLDNRKKTGTTSKEVDESSDVLGDIPRQASEDSTASVPEKNTTASRDTLPARREPSFIGEDDTMLLPTISVEMGSRYKICSQNPVSEDSVLFFLDCRYVRVLRWSGLADSGRIFISIVRK
mmetsp:Transcript_18576/g.34344  ORF Transcript_18576/g.34344 Transcript_18576/m.34344 type:complete len:829 (+) Transcript_18576:43-2529(+)